MRSIQSHSSCLLAIIGVFCLVTLSAHALVKESGAKTQKIQPLNRTSCEQFLKQKAERKLSVGTTHAGFVHHNSAGINSRRFQEFACGMKTATVGLSTILSVFLVVLFVSFIIVMVIFYKRKQSIFRIENRDQ